MVRVQRRRRVTREMFAAAGYALCSHRLVESGCVPHDLLHVFSVAASFQGVVCFIIERNVEHRAKIEIESEESQQSPGNFSVTPDQLDIIPVSKLLSVRRFISDQPQPGYSSPFLID